VSLDVFTPEDALRSLETGDGWHRDEKTECKLWDDPAPSGYGPFVVFAEAFWGREAPPGLEWRHVCKNGRRGCIEPRHVDLADTDSLRHDPDPSVLTELPGFARLIRDEREARGQTQREFANELRVSLATIRAWEVGSRAPAADVLRWVARYLGWGDQEQQFMVTAVIQRVETATSGGVALRQAWEHIERMNGGPRKAAVVSVKPVAHRR
jgi:DNA-binding XRE family transcriptional regulator